MSSWSLASEPVLLYQHVRLCSPYPSSPCDLNAWRDRFRRSHPSCSMRQQKECSFALTSLLVPSLVTSLTSLLPPASCLLPPASCLLPFLFSSLLFSLLSRLSSLSMLLLPFFLACVVAICVAMSPLLVVIPGVSCNQSAAGPGQTPGQENRSLKMFVD